MAGGAVPARPGGAPRIRRHPARAHHGGLPGGRRLGCHRHGDQRRDHVRRRPDLHARRHLRPHDDRPRTPGLSNRSPCWRPSGSGSRSWARTGSRNAPRVPLFEDVLERFGGRIVLCLEAKDRDAYEPMMAAVVRRGLQRSVMVKVHYSSDVMELAAADGYPRLRLSGGAERGDAHRTSTSSGRRWTRPATSWSSPPASGRRERPFLPDALVACRGRHRHPGLGLPAASALGGCSTSSTSVSRVPCVQGSATSPARSRR